MPDQPQFTPNEHALIMKILHECDPIGWADRSIAIQTMRRFTPKPDIPILVSNFLVDPCLVNRNPLWDALQNRTSERYFYDPDTPLWASPASDEAGKIRHAILVG